MSRFPTATTGLGLAALAAVTLGGCEAPAFIAQGIAGDAVPARYELRQTTTLVMVDDPAERLEAGEIARRSAAQIRYQLEEHTRVPEIVPAEHLASVRAALGPDYSRTAIDRIGRRCEAKQVVYLRVTEVSLKREGQLLSARARGRVKVVDVAAGRRVFPDPAQHRRGAVVTARVPRKRVEATSERRGMLRRLAKRLGTSAAQLFYRHPREPVGDGV